MLTTTGLANKQSRCDPDVICRVQEEIKSARGDRQVRISFPEDVLQSGRLQKMLQSKVMIQRTRPINKMSDRL